jgi:hypothetical protein
VEVTAGGISIDAGIHNQNALEQALDNVEVLKHDAVDSHSEIYRNVSGVSLQKFGGDDGAAIVETYDKTNDATQFSVDLGTFFRTVSPNMLDLSLLPEIVVTIHLTGNNIITSGGNARTPAGFVGQFAAGAQSTFAVSNYLCLSLPG